VTFASVLFCLLADCDKTLRFSEKIFYSIDYKRNVNQYEERNI